MRTVALVALACFGVASGDPVPTPTPPPDKYAPRGMGAKPPEVLPNQGLGTSAGAIKLKKGVSFDDVRTQPTPIPYTPTTTPGCDGGSFKSTVASSMRRFDEFADVARQTPRISLSGPLGKLVELKQGLENSSAGAPACMAAVVRFALAYQNATIDGLSAFMGQNDLGSFVGTAIASDARAKYVADFGMLK